jgi:hypothetical protein
MSHGTTKDADETFAHEEVRRIVDEEVVIAIRTNLTTQGQGVKETVTKEGCGNLKWEARQVEGSRGQHGFQVKARGVPVLM